MFARCAAYIGDRASLTEERLPGINTIVMDEELTAAIGQAAKVSMGMDASPLDMSNVVTFTERMVKLAEYRKVRSYTVPTLFFRTFFV
jgi:nucleolar protein 56